MRHKTTNDDQEETQHTNKDMQSDAKLPLTDLKELKR